MKFEFDSNNATELRAVEAAVAVLLDRLTPERQILGEVIDGLKADPLVAAVTEDQDKLEAETQTLGAAFDKAVEQVGAETVVAEELDSAGQPWNPELHSSSRAKVADGTWKKKRGVKSEAPTPPIPPAPAPVTPPAPPVPVPAAAAPSAEQKIWALITGQVVTINRVLEVARAHGHADLGALRQADEAAKAEVLRVLEGE
jgi:hypothetical protein